MIKKIRDVLEIIQSKDMIKELGELEDKLDEILLPLRNLLAQDVRSTEVSSLLDHMTQVESWRERSVRFLALANTFVEHCKSDHFTLKKSKGITEFDRTAYQKNMTAGFIGLQSQLEGLIYSVDSRVNLCKKMLGLEDSPVGKFKG